MLLLLLLIFFFLSDAHTTTAVTCVCARKNSVSGSVWKTKDDDDAIGVGCEWPRVSRSVYIHDRWVVGCEGVVGFYFLHDIIIIPWSLGTQRYGFFFRFVV